MSAPNTAVASSLNPQENTLNTAGRTAGNTHSLQQPRTNAELAQWICGLTIGGRNVSSVDPSLQITEQADRKAQIDTSAIVGYT
jgi:hypothetical protein